MKKKTANAVHKKREPKIATSFRMSRTSYDLMRKLSEDLGISRGSILELSLRALEFCFKYTEPRGLPAFTQWVRKAAEQGAK